MNQVTKTEWMQRVRMMLGDISGITTQYDLEQRYYSGDSMSEAVNKIRNAQFRKVQAVPER